MAVNLPKSPKQSGKLFQIFPNAIKKDDSKPSISFAEFNLDRVLVLLKVDPLFDKIRDDSRFTELLKRIGLPQ